MALRQALLVFPALGVIGGGVIIGAAMRPEATLAPDAVVSEQPMTQVPAGSVLVRGAGAAVGAFEIDAKEVSVGEYARCVSAGACVPYASAADARARLFDRTAESTNCRGGRPDRWDEPMNCVDHAGAEAYCRWAGKRLPTRNEWWRAVGSRHPSGGAALHRSGKEHSWYAGEWTASPARVEKRELSVLRYVGQWRTGADDEKRAWEPFDDWLPVEVRSAWIGFRCAR
jgi:formylglycine-generating enzyme required for sulfatase activity